jgi:hypothetical protein
MTRMEHTTIFPRALSGLFDLSPRSYSLNRGGFSVDAKNLSADFAAIGRDLKKALKHEPSDERPRQS